MRPKDKKGCAWGCTGASQDHRNSCWKGLGHRPTLTPLALHTLCSPWPAFRPPACRWESPDLGDGSLHLWSALPVRKFSCRCKGHVGHRARCPRFYLLLFPPQTSASLCVPRLETPPVPKEGRLQTKATSVKARDRFLPGLQPLFLSL